MITVIQLARYDELMALLLQVLYVVFHRIRRPVLASLRPQVCTAPRRTRRPKW
jgi:hypothetical protein